MGATTDRYAVISSDCHGGASIGGYKPFLASKYHDDFDRWAATFENPYQDTTGADADRNWSSERRLREMEDFPETAVNRPAFLMRPACNGPIAWKDFAAVQRDIENLKAAAQAAGAQHTFMTSASPGVNSARIRPSRSASSHSVGLIQSSPAVAE